MTTSEPIRRVLSDEDLATIADRTATATSTVDLLSKLTAALFGVLLSSVGESLNDYGPKRRLNPSRFQIPVSQWHALAAAVTERAAEWGTGAQVALELVNVMPSTYDDPAVTVDPRPVVDRRPLVHEVHVDRAAVDTIDACNQHVARLAAHYGPTSTIYQQAHSTWHRQVSGMLAMSLGARTTVHPDGNLSLLVRTSSGLVYGIVFHGQARTCVIDGCKATAGADGRWHGRFAQVEHGHVPSIPFDAPTPGTWAAHS